MFSILPKTKFGFELHLKSASDITECQVPYPVPEQQILDSSNLKEFADGNFKFYKNGRKLSKWVENTVGKGEIAH